MSEKLAILLNEKSFAVCVKPQGVCSEDDGTETCMPFLLAESLGTDRKSIYTVHRLDREVGGVMVYAKNEVCAKKLSALVSERKIIKEYIAVVHSRPPKESDTLTDLLFRDSHKNKSFVVDKMRKGVKEASLEYTLLASKPGGKFGEISLLKIRLHTGRTHQIRVQFSSRNMPLVGDRRYGGGKDGCAIALFSQRLSFEHPFSKGKTVDISFLPDAALEPWSEFEIPQDTAVL